MTVELLRQQINVYSSVPPPLTRLYCWNTSAARRTRRFSACCSLVFHNVAHISIGTHPSSVTVMLAELAAAA